MKVSPAGLADLIDRAAGGAINLNSGQDRAGRDAEQRARRGGDHPRTAAWSRSTTANGSPGWCGQALQANPAEVEKFRGGKETVANWFYGQVMREAKGKANPQVVKEELDRQLRG